jgi:hypothetical protein
MCAAIGAMTMQYIRAITLTAAGWLALMGCADSGDGAGGAGSGASSTGAGTSTGTGAGGSGGMGTGGIGTGGMGTGGMGTGGMGTGGMGTGGMATGGGGTGGSANGGGGAGGSGPTQTVSLTIVDALSQAGLAGLTICDHADLTNCVQTNGTGQGTLTLPDTDVTVEYSGAGFRTHLLGIGQGMSSGNITTFAISNANVSAVLSIVGEVDDLTKGIVGSTASVAGATATLTPASGNGPFYSGASGIPDPMLTSTSNSGTFLFTSVDPGMREVAVSAANLSCVTDVGIVGAQANSAEALVEMGAITIVSGFNCQ